MPEVRHLEFQTAGAALARTATAPALAARLRQFFTKGMLALTDQALFSGANFGVNILLARWLMPAEYGAYSLAFSIFLLFGAVHSAILTEPMMIFGAGKYAERLPRYLRTLLSLHAAILAPATGILLLTAAVLGRVYSHAAQQASLGLALSSAFILAFWMTRRLPYVVVKPGWGVAASVAYCLTMMILVWALRAADLLSPMAAFVAMAGASIAGGIVSVMPFVRKPAAGAAGPDTRTVTHDHWHYGRWAIASAAVSWFPGQIYYALLPGWLGLEGAAGLRAITNFVMPVLQAIAALNMLLLPALVRDRRVGGAARMNATMRFYLLIFGASCAAFMALLWLLRGQAFVLFYNGRYSEYAGWPLLLAGTLPVGTCATAVLGNALRALERPDRMFWAYVVSAASAALLGIPLAARFGVSGALAGIHISSLTLALMMWFFYRSLASDGKPTNTRGQA